jgi:hypothetical protein
MGRFLEMGSNRHDPDLVISKERQRLRNLFPVAQDFSLALEMTKALLV